MLTNFSNAFMFGKGKYIGGIALSIVYDTCSLQLWLGPPEITSKKNGTKKIK